MACVCANQTLAGLCKDCGGNVGGIIEVYAALYNTVSGTPAVSASVITGITMTSTAATWYKYQFRKNTGSLASTLNVTDAGDTYVTSELSLVFNKMEAKKRVEMAALSVQDLAVIVKDANGKYWYLGYNEPVNASAGEGQTGTNRTDSNHYGITLSDTSESFPYEVKDTVIEGLSITEATN